MVYEYDKENKLIKVDDEIIYLTNLENIVFDELYNKHSELNLLKMEQLSEILYSGYMFRENTISTAISRLRKKLKNKFEINNISGLGYYIKPNALNVTIDKLLKPKKEEEI